MLFDNSGGALEHIRAGRLRALATTSAERLAATPDVPTMRELGFANFDVSAWLGLAVPAATSPAIVQRLHEEVRKALEDDGVRGRITGAGAEPALRSPEEFQALVRREIPRWGRVIEAGGITAE
jgi:tripartite-type tricarboxylate transporter receptor subunit TctC